MNYKTTLVLIVLLSIVGGYFYFVEYGQISGYEAHEQQLAGEATRAVGKPVFTSDAPAADSIDRIRIQRGGREVMIEKIDDQWFQTQPVRFPLDIYGPGAVASQFASLRYVESLEPVEPDAPDGSHTTDAPTPAQIGLEKPRAVVTAWAGDKSWTLLLGKQTVDGHGYVQVQGENTAYVVDPSLHGAVLDQQINDWRSTSLDVPAASAIDHIELLQDDTVIGLTKTDGRWRIDGEGIQRASGEAVDDLLASANRLWITGFSADNPDNLALYGLDNPQLQLTLVFPPLPSDSQETSEALADEDATPTHPITRRLKIGRTDLDGNARYATWIRDGEPTTVVFTVNASSAEALARTVDDLRDPRVIVVSPQDVRDLVVRQAGETTLQLIRDPQAGYRFGDPQPDFDIDYSTAHRLIQQLCGLESTTCTDKISGLGDPISQVQLGVATGSGEVNFSIYRTGDHYTLVTRGEGVGYVIEADELIDRLIGPAYGLRKRTILDVTPDEITRIALTRPDGGVTYEFTHKTDAPGTGWTLTGHERYEDKTLASLLSSLNPLRVDQWLAPTDTPAPGKTGRIEVTIDIADGSPQTLSIGPANRQATMAGIDTAFTLPQPVIDLFNAEYRDRTAIDLDVNEIESVRVANDSTDITISRDGQRFVSDRGEVDQAVAAGVFDALAGLRVDRYVAPLHLRPRDIDFSVELTTTAGETRTLRLIDHGGDTVTVTLDPHGDQDYAGWFTLNREAVDRLRAPLVEIETPIK